MAKVELFGEELKTEDELEDLESEIHVLRGLEIEAASACEVARRKYREASVQVSNASNSPSKISEFNQAEVQLKSCDAQWSEANARRTQLALQLSRVEQQKLDLLAAHKRKVDGLGARAGGVSSAPAVPAARTATGRGAESKFQTLNTSKPQLQTLTRTKDSMLTSETQGDRASQHASPSAPDQRSPDLPRSELHRQQDPPISPAATRFQPHTPRHPPESAIRPRARTTTPPREATSSLGAQGDGKEERLQSSETSGAGAGRPDGGHQQRGDGLDGARELGARSGDSGGEEQRVEAGGRAMGVSTEDLISQARVIRKSAAEARASMSPTPLSPDDFSMPRAKIRPRHADQSQDPARSSGSKSKIKPLELDSETDHSAKSTRSLGSNSISSTGKLVKTEEIEVDIEPPPGPAGHGQGFEGLLWHFAAVGLDRVGAFLVNLQERNLSKGWGNTYYALQHQDHHLTTTPKASPQKGAGFLDVPSIGTDDFKGYMDPVGPSPRAATTAFDADSVKASFQSSKRRESSGSFRGFTAYASFDKGHESAISSQNSRVIPRQPVPEIVWEGAWREIPHTNFCVSWFWGWIMFPMKLFLAFCAFLGNICYREHTTGGEIKYPTLLVRDGYLVSPVARILPKEAQRSYFRMVLPKTQSKPRQPKSGVDWDGPMVVHFAATGDESFNLRQYWYANPLAAEHGVGSVIHMQSYYWKRRLAKNWWRPLVSSYSSAGQILSMISSTMDEGSQLVNWLTSPKCDGGLGLEDQVCVTGISLGGTMAAAIATGSQQRLACAACMPGHCLSAGFDLLLGEGADWDAMLQNGPQIPFSTDAEIPQHLSRFPTKKEQARDLVKALIVRASSSLTLPPPVVPEAMIVVAAAGDEIIPPESSYELARHAGSEMWWLPGGHATGCLFMQNPFRKAIVDALTRLSRKAL